jgi:hypothetical protein
VGQYRLAKKAMVEGYGLQPVQKISEYFGL